MENRYFNRVTPPVITFVLALVVLIIWQWPIPAALSGDPLRPIAIGPNFSELSVGPHAELLRGIPDELSIEQVSSPPWSGKFVPHHGDAFNYGLDTRAYWFRFKLVNKTGLERFPAMFLVLTRVLVPEYDVYVPLAGRGPGRFRHLSGGLDRIPFGSDDLGHRIRVMALPTDIRPDAYIYVRIKSKVVSYALNLYNSIAFDHYTRFEYVFFGTANGIMLAMLLYNLAVALFLRDRVFGSYCAYMACMIIYQALLTGWPLGLGLKASYLGDHVLTFFALSFIFAAVFAREFLGTKSRHPLIDALFKGTIVLSVVDLVISLSGNFDLANTIAYSMGVGAPILFLACATYIWRSGYTPARYYLAGWAVLMGFTMIYASSGMGLVEHSFIINNMVCIGGAIESILLALALADRIRLLQQEKLKLKEKERKLTVLSLTDELTGLYNKRCFQNRLPDEIAKVKTMGMPLSLLVCDVDHFKKFNDTYGHSTGDLILAELGDLFRDALRSDDIAFRYGGEEFAVLLPGIALEQARKVAERLRVGFAQRGIELPGGEKVGATISIGVSQLRSDDGKDDLFGRADKALYGAKNQGRDRVVAA